MQEEDMKGETCWEEGEFQQEREGEKREERGDITSNLLYTCMHLSKVKKLGEKVEFP